MKIQSPLVVQNDSIVSGLAKYSVERENVQLRTEWLIILVHSSYFSLKYENHQSYRPSVFASSFQRPSQYKIIHIWDI